MCDTIVVNKKLCMDGHTIFGKASDRAVNEPQPIVYVPAAEHEPGSRVKCTYIDVEQVAHTHAMILSKPSWIWGAEIGVNEHGLCIGNEAVFSKELNKTEEALLGMDIVRLALERASTAREAVEVIGYLMERYGQGGNAGFDSVFHYDNAYLIVDAEESWHVETAGKHLWAAQKVTGAYSISNYLSMNQPELMHESLIEIAKGKGYFDGENFDFAKAYIDWSNPVNRSGMLRRCCSYQMANRYSDHFLAKNMVELLQTHFSSDPWTEGAECVCMHAHEPADEGGIACETTSAMVAVCRGKDTLIWTTGMGVTCVAPFQPCWFDAYSRKQVFPYESMEAGIEQWVKRERISRGILAGSINEKEYKQELAAMQQDWFVRVEAVQPDQSSRQALCDAIADEAEAFLDKWLERVNGTVSEPVGSEAFRSWWQKKNAELGKDSRMAW